MRPPTPVPVSDDRSTPRSAASLRTSGVTYGEPLSPPPSPAGADAPLPWVEACDGAFCAPAFAGPLGPVGCSVSWET